MVATEFQRTDDGVLFVVRTDDAAYAEALPRAAYPGDGGVFARRFRRYGEDVEEIYERFASCIEEMLAQLVHREAAPWEDALEQAAARLDAAGIDWFLVGSAALGVRGIPVTPRDVDFAAVDGERVANAFSDVLVEPPIFDPDWVADWFGRTWMGAIVEWAADVHPELDDWRTPQESGPEAQAALEEVDWRGRVIRVTPLAKQLAVSESRGLHDRVEAIRRFERGRTG